MSPSLVRGVVVLLTWKAPSKRLVGPNLLLCWKKDIFQTILYYYSKNLPPCYLGRPLTTMRDTTWLWPLPSCPLDNIIG